MGARGKTLLLTAGALILFVLLYFAPKMVPESGTGSNAPASEENLASDANVKLFLDMAVQKLEPPKKETFDKHLAAKSFDSLAAFWNQMKRPDLSSFFAEEMAKNKNSSAVWFDAGNRFYYSVQFIQDKSEIPVLYQSAIRCYEKGLQLDPGNVDAKIMLASCYVDGSRDPMKGITILREIEKTDSNNVKLQITFATFSVKSGQLDKAIRRFNKVLEIDSTYIEAYLHLADAYEQMNNKAETIHMLEEYAARTSDITSKMEIAKYIKQLKGTN